MRLFGLILRNESSKLIALPDVAGDEAIGHPAFLKQNGHLLALGVGQ